MRKPVFLGKKLNSNRTPMNDIFTYTLDFFRLGLNLTVLKKSSLIQWADQHLMDNTWPDYNHLLVDFSLCQANSVKETTALISEVIGQASTRTGGRLFLGHLYRQQDLQSTTHALGYFLPLMALSSEEEEKVEEIYFNFKFDSHFYPMQEEDIQRAQKEALAFLSLYERYTLDNLAHLALIEQYFALKLEHFLSY